MGYDKHLHKDSESANLVRLDAADEETARVKRTLHFELKLMLHCFSSTSGVILSHLLLFR